MCLGGCFSVFFDWRCSRFLLLLFVFVVCFCCLFLLLVGAVFVALSGSWRIALSHDTCMTHIPPWSGFRLAFGTADPFVATRVSVRRWHPRHALTSIVDMHRRSWVYSRRCASVQVESECVVAVRTVALMSQSCKY